MKKIKDIAVLLTVHNRKKKTLLCLEHLYKSFNHFNKEESYNLDVFLTDDGSTDGTSEAVLDAFSDVTIIKGTGSLFWNKGMRLAWKNASDTKAYDFYLWINDDTYIINTAIEEIITRYNNYKTKNSKEPIVVGACVENLEQNIFSYGLRDASGRKLMPKKTFEEGTMMNGNFVLVSQNVFNTLGNLSNIYTHAMGDYDYGLRALEKGIVLITTENYIGVCETHKNIPKWRDPKIPLQKRWQLLNSPLGLNINEYKQFKKRFSKKNYQLVIAKIYLDCIFPQLFYKSKK